MTQPNLDAERPRETMPCNCPADGECANECTACQYAADNVWDCDHQGAAVHQVAKCVNHCEHDPLEVMDGVCRHDVFPAVGFEEECGHVCTFAPAEVHQTPEPSQGCTIPESDNLKRLQDEFIRPNHEFEPEFAIAKRMAGTQAEPWRCVKCEQYAVVNNICVSCGNDNRARYGDFERVMSSAEWQNVKANSGDALKAGAEGLIRCEECGLIAGSELPIGWYQIGVSRFPDAPDGIASHCPNERQNTEGLFTMEESRQHVAPPRIWHSGALQIAMQSGSWFDRKDLGLAQRESQVADIVSDFAESVVNARIAPIKAALEACEREALHPDGRISFRKLDYDALVVTIK